MGPNFDAEYVHQHLIKKLDRERDKWKQFWNLGSGITFTFILGVSLPILSNISSEINQENVANIIKSISVILPLVLTFGIYFFTFLTELNALEIALNTYILNNNKKITYIEGLTELKRIRSVFTRKPDQLYSYATELYSSSLYKLINIDKRIGLILSGFMSLLFLSMTTVIPDGNFSLYFSFGMVIFIYGSGIIMMSSRRRLKSIELITEYMLTPE